MRESRNHTLGLALRDFFQQYLPLQRGMSPHTICSYRDTLKLFLQFLAEEKTKEVLDLTIEMIGTDEILAFLDHLEKHRRNVPGTRNVRLSALHSFFRYLAARDPQYLYQSQCVLNIPFKKSITSNIEYLESQEIAAVLQSVDRSKSDGRRDYLLLSLMFNTGARVQELVDLKANDFRLTKPFSVHIIGKGRKQRICPIWPETAQLAREYMEKRGIDAQKPVPLFLNHLGTPLTRFGVRYILAKYVRKAARSQPNLGKKRLHPHSIRHSTAVHLLQSGVDLSTIAHWLGHASINTTHKYTAMDLDMKRKAIAKAKPLNSHAPSKTPWRENHDILAWLESL